MPHTSRWMHPSRWAAAARWRLATRWSLTARLTTVLGAAVVLLAAVAGVAAMTANESDGRVDQMFNAVAPLRDDSQQLLVALLDQETGVRGYAIDGQSVSLEPYQSGRDDEARIVADIERRDGPYPQVASALTAVEQRAGAWRTAVADPAISRAGAGDIAGARTILEAAGTTQFDDVRQAVGTLEADVAAVRDEAVAGLKQSSGRIVAELVIAAWIVLMTGIVLVWLLKRLVTGPVHRLADHVRLVASGDIEHAIDVPGPPEVAELGRDVEDMRRRIVDDLKVLQDAHESVALANARLRQHAAELVRSNQDLEQFATVASHGLQEPLRKVASFSALLQSRYAGRLDERADRYIAFAVDGANRMQRLIDDLLEFSRIGRAGREFADVALDEVAVRVREANRSAVEATGGYIDVGDLPTVVGDGALLEVLMTNVIGNAVKFRRDGVAVHITVSATQDGPDWRVTVADNGVGVDPAYAERMFVIFQRAHPREQFPGTGVGLAVAKRIVEYHGGRIWSEPAAGCGTAIHFTLPTAPVGAPVPA